MNKIPAKVLLSTVLTFVVGTGYVAPSFGATDAETTATTSKKKKKAKAAKGAAAAKASVAASRKRTVTAAKASQGGAIALKKDSLALPTSQSLAAPVATHSLGAVKPPRSNEFYDGASKEVEYEKLVDQEINALYKLSQQNKRSPNRGEIWLRLGERYVEKARLVSFREQSDFDQKVKDFSAKKTHIKPKLDSSLSHDYNKKAVQLYEWFANDFPKDPKIDQALFFLGYNQFELENPQAGERYYLDLVHRFPESPYVTESHFALGEYYFENEQWRKALDNYNAVVAVKKARLNAFALYKSSWCYYRTGQVPLGLKALERVIRMSRANESNDSVAGRRAVNKIRLGSEALKDYVPFFAEAGNPKIAAQEFQRLTGDEAQTKKMLERLAYVYADSGNRPAATYTFKQLISMDPTGEKSAEYQYQIVLSYATTDRKIFSHELDVWLESFGAGSFWAKENAKNPKLVADVTKLQETTVRNNVLQLHQTAQNARTESGQRAAAVAYAQYFKYFSDSSQAIEMRFFQAELLYDMEHWADAAKLYSWVADKDPKGPYHDRAVLDTMLALEKDLPTPQQIEAKRGSSLEPIPLDPPVARFEVAALKFMNEQPKAEKTPDIQRRLAVLYYGYNQFDKASELFERIIRENPKSGNAEVAGNLLLDIYKLRGDMIGFADKGQQLLLIPAIANSKFGSQIRTMLEKASFVRADKLAEKGENAKAAKEFETYAQTYKQSELATGARYKAAMNYEKAGDAVSASRMYGMVLASDSSDSKTRILQNDSRNALARIYQQTGQLELAAKQYRDYASANVKDQKAVNGFFNAGVIYDGLGATGEAHQSYESYLVNSRNSDRFETLYLQAKMYQRQGMSDKARAYFDRYLKEGARNMAHVIEATFEVAKAIHLKGGVTKAKEGWQKTMALNKRATPAVKEATAAFAAEARFNLAQDTLRELQGVRFTSNDRQQGKAAAQVLSLQAKYINEMKEVVRYNNAPWIVAALSSGGRMYDLSGDQFMRIPTPAGYKPDEAAKYRELINQKALGFKSDAKASYKAAIEKSQELEAYTEWTETARRGLLNLEPQSKGLVLDEIATDAKATDWMGL